MDAAPTSVAPASAARRGAHLCALAAALALAACLAGAAAPTGAGADGLATVTHAPSKFSIRAPAGSRLSVSKGVYVLRAGPRTLTFSRSVTTVTPLQFGGALLGQLGGRVLSRGGDARQFSAEVQRGSRREGVVVVRDGTRLAVATSSAPSASPVALALLRRVAASARGGFALSAPASSGGASSGAKSIPLVQYRAPDGGATALVPAGWNVQSAQGSIEGSSAKGSFLFGFSINVLLPQNAPPTGNALVAPYLNAATALAQIIPRLAPTVSDIRIVRTIKDAALPTFTSSAMYLFEYRVSGRRWVGAAMVGTDSPAKYGNFVWNFYYSGIGVPAGSDPSVGVGLLRSWKSWNPSGAIAARTRAALQLVNETNQVWKDTLEFRSRTADRQSRDVGCLLQGYYVIEDNSRKYDLPPLPCGQVYVPRS